MKIYENTVFLKNNSIDTRECISAEWGRAGAGQRPPPRLQIFLMKAIQLSAFLQNDKIQHYIKYRLQSLNNIYVIIWPQSYATPLTLLICFFLHRIV